MSLHLDPWTGRAPVPEDTSRSVAILARTYLPADQAERIAIYGA